MSSRSNMNWYILSERFVIPGSPWSYGGSHFTCMGINPCNSEASVQMEYIIQKLEHYETVHDYIFSPGRDPWSRLIISLGHQKGVWKHVNYWENYSCIACRWENMAQHMVRTTKKQMCARKGIIEMNKTAPNDHYDHSWAGTWLGKVCPSKPPKIYIIAGPKSLLKPLSSYDPFP